MSLAKRDMEPAGHLVISCEPGREVIATRPVGVVTTGDQDVVDALAALPSVARPRLRPMPRRPALSAGAANVFAVLGSLSTVALGYLVYALFAPVY